MSLKSGQTLVVQFCTQFNGLAVDADSTPTAVLAINGVDNSATVTVTDIGTGRYRASVTLPTLSAGDCVTLTVTATVKGVSSSAVIFQAVADTKRVSDLNDLAAGAEMGLTTATINAIRSGLSTLTAAQVWTYTSRTLTSFGTLASDVASAVWSAATRTLTGFGGLVSDIWSAATRTITGTVVLDASQPYYAPAVAGDTMTINSEDEVAIAAAVIAGLGALDVTVASPVAPDGTITIYQGDDYAASEGRAIEFSVSDAAHVLGLDSPGAGVRLKLSQATFVASAVSSLETGYLIVFEPSSAETAALTSPRQNYELEATTAAGHIVTLQRGTVTVTRDIPTL